MRRAGSTNSGSRISASSVICHDSPSITTSVSTRVIELPTTPDRVQVKARWAPITSLLSRLTRAPVRVRVKKATGIRCTWPNTARRRSRIRPSPSLADCHRSARPTPPSASATPAMIKASTTTRLCWPPSMMASTTRPARTGVATASRAVTTLRPMKTASSWRWGAANCHTRRRVARLKERRGCWPCMALSSAIQ
jgi:hypothetical protein